MHKPVFSVLSAAVCLILTAATANAQFQVSDPATGETYRVEIGGYLGSPDPRIIIASESFDLPGDEVDFGEELGLQKERVAELRVTLRPARKHKFRFQYLPIQYEGEAIISREFVFNGQRFTVGLPVNTTVNWKTYRFAYEYDFIYRDRGFLGFILDAKYTVVDATLDSFIGSEFASAKGPIPTIGAIGRAYVVPNISITGEISGFKLPNVDDDYEGEYIDGELYGTVNFTDHFGAQVGYRWRNVEYRVDLDSGNLELNGPFFGGVVRF
jgi:hypothetical protein